MPVLDGSMVQVQFGGRRPARLPWPDHEPGETAGNFRALRRSTGAAADQGVSRKSSLLRVRQ